MTPVARWWGAAAALSGFAAVALGALGAHLLPVHDPALFDLAWRYHALHVLAMLFVASRRPMTILNHCVLAGCAAGTLAFCGTLYRASVVTGASTALAPFGGSLLMVSWLLLAVAMLRKSPTPP